MLSARWWRLWIRSCRFSSHHIRDVDNGPGIMHRHGHVLGRESLIGGSVNGYCSRGEMYLSPSVNGGLTGVVVPWWMLRRTKMWTERWEKKFRIKINHFFHDFISRVKYSRFTPWKLSKPALSRTSQACALNWLLTAHQTWGSVSSGWIVGARSALASRGYC